MLVLQDVLGVKQKDVLRPNKARKLWIQVKQVYFLAKLLGAFDSWLHRRRDGQDFIKCPIDAIRVPYFSNED